MEDIKCIVINMEKDTNRKAHMQNLLTELGFKNINFVIPIKPDENIIKKIKDNYYPKLTTKIKSNVSLFATTLNILENEHEEQFIIFEDDIIPVENIEITRQNIIKSLTEYPKDAHLVYLEYCMEYCYKRQKRKDNFYRLYKPLCAAAIFYPSKQKKEEILSLLKTLDTEQELFDQIYPYLSKKQIINCYSLGLIFRQYYSLFGSQLETSLKDEHPECVEWYFDKDIKNKIQKEFYTLNQRISKKQTNLINSIAFIFTFLFLVLLCKTILNNKRYGRH